VSGILFFQKGNAGTITRLYLSCADCKCEEKPDSVIKFIGSDKNFVYYSGNSCCIKYTWENWDEINKILEKYTSTVTYLKIDIAYDCITHIPIADFKNLKTISFNGWGLDPGFDSIPENILEMKSLQKIKFNKEDHARKMKKQIKSERRGIKVRIVPHDMKRVKKHAEPF
jgi:hypothetical protein